MLSPDTAQCNTTDDELGQQQINNDHRQDGNGHQHIDLAHIELEEVGTAELCNEDGQSLLSAVSSTSAGMK